MNHDESPTERERAVSDSTTDYHLTLLRRFVWPSLTKRQRRRLLRIDPLLYGAVRGLGEPGATEYSRPAAPDQQVGGLE